MALDEQEIRLIDELEKNLESYYTKQEKLRGSIESYKKALHTIHQQQDEIRKAEIAQKAELKKLNAKVHEMEAQMVLTPQQSNLYCRKFSEAERSLRETTALMPRTGSFFLYLFLGKVNVVIDKPTDRYNYKEHYENFKKRITTWMIPVSLFMIVCLERLHVFPMRVFDFLFNVFLVYYYLTLSIREHILRVNGSNIARWWTLHHTFSLTMTLVMLTWPYSTFYLEFRFYMYLFTTYLSAVQLLQIRYQMAQLYRLRSLGQASDVDAADSDAGYYHWTRSMTFLLPFLIFGQLFQIYNAVLLTNLWLQGAEWQAAMCGALFLLLGSGNMYVTLRTYYRKMISPRKEHSS